MGYSFFIASENKIKCLVNEIKLLKVNLATTQQENNNLCVEN